MTKTAASKTSAGDKFAYDYANRCDCSDDDKCGCSFPNNLSHNYDINCEKDQEENCSTANNINIKKIEIKTPNTHLEKESVCVCSPTQCDCSITRNEKNK